MDRVENSTRALICTGRLEGRGVDVVLADGSYATGTEQVFWLGQPETEVLRVPIGTPVSSRPVHRGGPVAPDADTAQGEEALLAAVVHERDHRGSRPTRMRRRLARTLTCGQVLVAEALATLAWRQQGLAAAHSDLSACLRDVDERFTSGSVTSLEARRTALTARAVLERLHAATTAAGGRGRVVLAVPVGDTHTLALTALAHQLHEAGFRALVVDDLPVAELAALAARHDTVAVVLSAHLPWSAASARRAVSAVRLRAPGVLVVVGGPGAPTSVHGCDLVTDDPTRLLRALHAHRNLLTPREYQVLQAVADGRSNNEISLELGIAPATVKSHLEQVFAKTETTHRAAAVARALRQGWIT